MTQKPEIIKEKNNKAAVKTLLVYDGMHPIFQLPHGICPLPSYDLYFNE